MTQRRDYIDELKGLGILLVVFGQMCIRDRSKTRPCGCWPYWSR